MNDNNGQGIQETNLPNLLSRGKVRDTYDLGKGYLLIIATDRISAFDVVLPTPIPEKGVVLSSMSSYWFQETSHIIPNHLISMANISSSTPNEISDNPTLANLDPDLARRAMIVKRAKRIDIECVVRGYITGSAWAEYQKSGTVSGQPIDTGLKEGDPFPEPIFTPTTKAEQGHDEPMSMQEVEDMVGPELASKLEKISIEVYQFAHDQTKRKGILIADTKMEFGLLDDELILIDELLTPDSSRFWDLSHYEPGKSLPNYDKQFVRDWLTKIGWDREPPGPVLTAEIVSMTKSRYIEAYEMILGKQWG